MKRAIIASFLGLAISIASTQGQALYIFDTYIASLAAPQGVVEWPSLTPPGQAGQPVLDSDGVKADLLWQVGTLTGDLGLAVPTSTVGGSPGWIRGPAVSFDDSYTDFAPITFTIEVWIVGNSYGSQDWINGTLTWTEPGQAVHSGYDSFMAMPNTPIVLGTPEPAMIALVGLGAAAILVSRLARVALPRRRIW